MIARTGAFFGALPHLVVQGFNRSLRPKGAKVTRARIGLLILGFTAVYCIIGLRLVQLGMETEAHFSKRGSASDSIAASRPVFSTATGGCSLPISRPSRCSATRGASSTRTKRRNS